MKIIKSIVILMAVIGEAGFSLVNAQDAGSVEFATGNKTKMLRVGAQWNWNNQWWQSHGNHIGGYWDLSLAQWRGQRYQNNPDATQNITVIGITPVFRWQNDNKMGFYGEAGVGANLFSQLYDNNGRRLSTAFEFGDHVGVGYIFQNKLDMGIRLQHYSNGGIKQPNSGVNFAVMRVSYRF